MLTYNKTVVLDLTAQNGGVEIHFEAAVFFLKKERSDKEALYMSWDIDVREKVYQRLANEIFFRILRGEYALGAKLPSYIDFAKEAGSSPETVRKAIRELQQQGVVEKTRQGYFVTSDEATVTAFRERYLASVEKEYQNARGKVET